MTTKSIPIEDATAAQVREFATRTHNLDIATTSNKAMVLSKLEAAGWNGSHITVEDTDAIIPVNPITTTTDPATGKRRDAKGREICTIIIPLEDRPGGNEAVFGSLNGTAFEVPRGKPVDVPVMYVEVLEQATGLRWQSMTQGLKNPRFVPSVPVTRIG